MTDIRPPYPADGRGLYPAIGLIVGGRVASSAPAVSHGVRLAGIRRTTIRPATPALLSIASGPGGAIIVDPVFGASPGHFGALCGIGALTTFTAAAVGMALQALSGQLGVGPALLVFAVLGSPSAGGVLASLLLPPYWSATGQALPTGAATTLVRNTVYCSGNATALAWWVPAAWAVGGLLVSYAARCAVAGCSTPPRSRGVAQVTRTPEISGGVLPV